MSASETLKHFAIAIKGWFFANNKLNEPGAIKRHKKLFIPDARNERIQFSKKAILSDFTIL